MVTIRYCDMCKKEINEDFLNNYESYLIHHKKGYDFVVICTECQQVLFNWITKGNKL